MDRSLSRLALAGLLLAALPLAMHSTAVYSQAAPVAVAAAPAGGYQLPPKPLQALVDAPRPPQLSISPHRDLLALTQAPALPGIDVVVVSMYDESIYALRVLKAGARAYVMKQDVTTRVLDAIRRARNGQLFVSERVATQMLNRFVDGTEDGAADSPVSSLSDRELEIVNLIGEGLPTREIAAKLFLSIKTVETHRVHIKRKLNLQNATQLVQFCVRWVEENKAANATEAPAPLAQPA